MYYEKGNFDTIETQIVYDICQLQQDLAETKMRIEAKVQVGRMTMEKMREFKKDIKAVKVKMLILTDMPLIRVYKNYDYFKFNRALQDINLN